jgi:hypothetical protein
MPGIRPGITKGKVPKSGTELTAGVLFGTQEHGDE